MRGMAFLDMGDQFLAVAEGRRQGPDGGRHFGLVVDDREAVRAALKRGGHRAAARPRAAVRATRGATTFEIVDYRDIQFTKAPSVLRGMGLDGLEKTAAARAELAEKGLRLVRVRLGHRLEPAHQQVERELEALVVVARGEVVGERDERRELVRRQRAEVGGELLRAARSSPSGGTACSPRTRSRRRRARTCRRRRRSRAAAGRRPRARRGCARAPASSAGRRGSRPERDLRGVAVAAGAAGATPRAISLTCSCQFAGSGSGTSVSPTMRSSSRLSSSSLSPTCQ